MAATLNQQAMEHAMASRPAITDPVRPASWPSRLSICAFCGDGVEVGRRTRRRRPLLLNIWVGSDALDAKETAQVFPNKDRGGPKITFVSRPRANVVAPVNMGARPSASRRASCPSRPILDPRTASCRLR